MRRIINKEKKRICSILFIIMFFVFPSLHGHMLDGYHQTKEYEQYRIEIPDWYNIPNDYAELVSWYLTLESQFPEYIDVFKANERYDTGIVEGGYDLYYVRITDESRGFHKPEVLFVGSPHGDETVGTIGLYWFSHWIMRKACTDEPCIEYSKDWLRWLLDHREIYIVISQNPYGFDKNRRLDAHNWDLNREADYDGPGQPTGGIWGSVNGRTLRAFIDHHMIRIGCDFHGGVRMILYPWSSTYSDIYGMSRISGKLYKFAPPDFHFFDVSSLRVGSYIGSYGGILDELSIGPIPMTVGYEAKGAISPWAYAADIEKHPKEDPMVNDEIFGNYPGTGILWLSPEMSRVKNPGESSFGNDTIDRFGAEVRRFVLHQTDLAQPYIRWISPTELTIVLSEQDAEVTFRWQVNGSLAVDETVIEWDTDPFLIDPMGRSENLADPAFEFFGGTGWDHATDGTTQPTTYEKSIQIPKNNTYYVRVKAKVDQIYKQVIQGYNYDNTSYLRLVQERTNESYHEVIQGSDGKEEINGSLWWYSPIIQVSSTEINSDFTLTKPIQAVYINNKPLWNRSNNKIPLVIGPIDICIQTIADPSAIEQVSVFVDSVLVKTDYEYPYCIRWDEIAFGMKEVTVNVFFTDGKQHQKSFSLLKFF